MKKKEQFIVKKNFFKFLVEILKIIYISLGIAPIIFTLFVGTLIIIQIKQAIYNMTMIEEYLKSEEIKVIIFLLKSFCDKKSWKKNFEEFLGEISIKNLYLSFD